MSEPPGLRLAASRFFRVQGLRLSAALWFGSVVCAVTACSSDPDIVDESDSSDLANAVGLHLESRVRTLLERGANPNDITAGDSVVFLAAAAGDDEIVQLLLDFGAEPDIERSEPALVGAAVSGSIASIRMLVAAGADVCVESDDWGGTLPEIARAYGSDDAAQMLGQLTSDRC